MVVGLAPRQGGQPARRSTSLRLACLVAAWASPAHGLVPAWVGAAPSLSGRARAHSLRAGASQGARTHGVGGLTMQRRPGDSKRSRPSRSAAPLTALQMTMTRLKRTGGSFEDRKREFVDEVKIVAAGSLIGGVTGLLVLLFKAGIAEARHQTFQGPWAQLIDWLQDVLKAADIHPPDPLLPLILSPAINLEFASYPLLGGIVTTLLILFLKASGEATGFGPPLSGQLEELQRGTAPNLKRSTARIVGAMAALGSGCSLGPEGPSVEIGVTTSRVVSQLLGLDQAPRQVLAAAGAAAGVSAGFNAPLTGVVFALEILLPSLNAAEIANAKEHAKLAPGKDAAAATAAVLFESIDEDKNGLLDEREVGVALSALRGRQVTPQELEVFWRSVDAKGEKVISSDEFVRAVSEGQGMDFSYVFAAQAKPLLSEAVSVSKSTAGAVLTASAIACLVVRSGLTDVEAERFVVANYALVNTFTELPFYMTLGVLTGGVAATFQRLSTSAKTFYAGGTPGFEFMGKVPVQLRPMLGAALCGVVATKYPGVLFFGYGMYTHTHTHTHTHARARVVDVYICM
jgi:H+/Cl- antiporter ClcA